MLAVMPNVGCDVTPEMMNLRRVCGFQPWRFRRGPGNRRSYRLQPIRLGGFHHSWLYL